MARTTSSSNRGRRSASKRPTSSKTRATRSKASNARVTRSGQGGSRGSSTRVTRGSAASRTRTSSARVTGANSSRPALPPGKKGGQLAIRRRSRRTNTNRATSSGRTQMGTRGSAKPQLRLPAARPGAAASFGAGISRVAGGLGLGLSALQTAKDLKESLQRGEGYARIPGLLRRIAKDKSGARRKGGQGGRPRGNVTPSKPKTKSKPTTSKPSTTPKKDRLDRDERRARERSRDTPPPAPRLPAPAATRPPARPKPTTKPKAKSSGKSVLDKEIAGAQTFIATYKGKGPGMQRAVKKMKERLARLRAKKNTGKSDLAKANRNVA